MSKPLSNQLLAYLRLVRLPTVFTAMADVLAGFLFTADSFSPAFDFCCLLTASVCLYWSGMVFNDVFDLQQDLAERPGRPIPAGEISKSAAVKFGLVLILAGNASAALVSHSSLVIAVCLTTAIICYDGLLKRTVLGPVAMGSCRFLNMMMAASAIGDWNQIWQRPQLQVAAGLGIYVCGLTWFARNEAAVSQRNQLIAATVVSLMGIAILAQLPISQEGAVPTIAIHTALAIIAIIAGRRMLAAITKPQPGFIQVAIRTMLLSIVTMDATMIYYKTGNVTYALTAVALIIPAVVLARRFAMT